MAKMDKELIEHIKSQLENHEEAYAPGAWERFAEKDRKQKGLVYWPLWTAAAVVLVAMGIFFSVIQTNKKVEIVTRKPKSEFKKPVTSSSDSMVRIASVTKVKSSNIKEQIVEKISNNVTDAVKKNVIENSLETQKTFNNSSIAQSKLSNPTFDVRLPLFEPAFGEVLLQKTNQDLAKKLTFEQLLLNDSKIQHAKNAEKTKSASKWESGIYVAPAVGNDSKVNVNYGFSFSYAVANKLSISSGISYTSLSSSETISKSSPQTLSGRNLSAVSAKVNGINVPLELRYNISDKIYTGVGVSALAILNNSQNNTYLSNEVQSFASPSSTLTTEVRQFIVQEKTVEPQPAAATSIDDYIGFYNFSLGYKQKISKKNNISVEPFLQLPMKTFSKENLNLTNGGVRLKFDF